MKNRTRACMADRMTDRLTFLSANLASPTPIIIRCVLQWELSGAASAADAGGLKDIAEAVAEEESDGYVLDLKDGSDLDRGSDFEAAAEERRAPVSLR